MKIMHHSRPFFKIVLAALCACTRFVGAEDSFAWDGVFSGAESNGVKAGLQIAYSSSTTNQTVFCQPFLSNSRATNGNVKPNKLRLWLPPLENRFQLTLWDENGHLVGKTAKGKALWKPISVPLNLKT